MIFIRLKHDNYNYADLVRIVVFGLFLSMIPYSN